MIPNCGFVCLLSDEKLDQKESTGTIISPIKEHPVSLTEIFNRAERVSEILLLMSKRERILQMQQKSKVNLKNGTYTGMFALLLVNVNRPYLKFLGATPDGDVDGGLIEIKRIFSNGLTLCDAVCKRNICKQISHGLVVVNKNHKFYYQIQLQMFCAECNWTDLVLSDLNDLIILHIKKCNRFLSSVIPKLELFYDKNIALELAYPRVAYGLQRVSKLIEE